MKGVAGFLMSLALLLEFFQSPVQATGRPEALRQLSLEELTKIKVATVYGASGLEQDGRIFRLEMTCHF